MREDLGLDASKGHGFLLNNLGKCLTKCKRPKKAIELLESARDMAEKLADNDEPTDYKANIYTHLALAYNSLKDSENTPKKRWSSMDYAMSLKNMTIKIFRKFHQDTLETTDIYMNFLKTV